MKLNTPTLLVLTLFATLLAPCSAMANTSLGLGLQYGVVGARFSDESGTANLSFSLGLLGAGAGFERPISKGSKVTVGANLGVSILGPWLAASLNYQFGGFRHTGWVLGADLGFYQNAWDDDESDEKTFLSLNLGYRF